MFRFLKTIFQKIDQGTRASHQAFVSDLPNRGLSREKAASLQQAFLATLKQDDRDLQFNAAAKLMTGGQYTDCIEAYQKLIAKYPRDKGLCESQIGAAYYFLGQYQKAIEYYASARENGADSEMMDDNIWEACEALHKAGDPNAISYYKSLCPNGKYTKKADKLLG